MRTTRGITRSEVQTDPAAERTRPDETPTLTFATGSGAAEADAITAHATRRAVGIIRTIYYNLVANLEQPCTKLTQTGPPTVLFEVFWTHQKRKRLVEAALEGVGLPPEDYPFYVTIGADGPLTPTELAELLELPLSTASFRVRRLERRGHAERVPNPSDGRSFLIRLTPPGRRLLRKARPRFRAYAEAVERRLGARKTKALTAGLSELREAIDAELTARATAPPRRQ
jgi:DNA-binding MarR family transcriptional regulator